MKTYKNINKLINIIKNADDFVIETEKIAKNPYGQEVHKIKKIIADNKKEDIKEILELVLGGFSRLNLQYLGDLERSNKDNNDFVIIIHNSNEDVELLKEFLINEILEVKDYIINIINDNNADIFRNIDSCVWMELLYNKNYMRYYDFVSAYINIYDDMSELINYILEINGLSHLKNNYFLDAIFNSIDFKKLDLMLPQEVKIIKNSNDLLVMIENYYIENTIED